MTETDQKIPMHYVCTIEEARELVENRDRFWVMNCDCRDKKGTCQKSRHDVCLEFYEQTSAIGTGHHEITKEEVEEILKEAEEKHLASRPFRDYNTRTKLEGICFCCDCCCYYFRSQDEPCGIGQFIESTDMNSCTHCGECVEVCYFKARSMDNGEHAVDREKCYGCGLCVSVCPEECIEMVQRA